jgi:peptidoglycan/LPS O-acetylase OafA/YrhL
MPPSKSPSTEPLHLPVLDGFRGAAVLAVMFYHFVAMSPMTLTSHAGKGLRFLTIRGWMGVDLFFVLSGFLITGILLREKADPRYFRNFYARRFLRIFPLYYAFLFAAFVVAPMFLPLDLASRHVYDLQGWLWAYLGNVETAISRSFDFDGGWYNLVHLWSLAVEEHFYLFWPLLVWSMSERALLRVAIGACVAAPLLRTVLAADHVFMGTIYMLTPCRIDGLAMGAILAILWRDPERFARVASGARWVLLVALGFLGVITLRRLDNWHWSIQTIGYSIIDAGSAALLVVALGGRGLWPRVLAGRTLRTFGKYSYGAYLMHWPIQAPLQRLYYDPIARTGHEAVALAIYSLASVGTTLLLAAAVWHGYERWFLNLKRFFKSAPSEAVVASGAAPGLQA